MISFPLNADCTATPPNGPRGVEITTISESKDATSDIKRLATHSLEKTLKNSSGVSLPYETEDLLFNPNLTTPIPVGQPLPSPSKSETNARTKLATDGIGSHANSVESPALQPPSKGVMISSTIPSGLETRVAADLNSFATTATAYQPGFPIGGAPGLPRPSLAVSTGGASSSFKSMGSAASVHPGQLAAFGDGIFSPVWQDQPARPLHSQQSPYSDPVSTTIPWSPMPTLSQSLLWSDFSIPRSAYPRRSSQTPAKTLWGHSLHTRIQRQLHLDTQTLSRRESLEALSPIVPTTGTASLASSSFSPASASWQRRSHDSVHSIPPSHFKLQPNVFSPFSSGDAVSSPYGQVDVHAVTRTLDYLGLSDDGHVSNSARERADDVSVPSFSSPMSSNSTKERNFGSALHSGSDWGPVDNWDANTSQTTKLSQSAMESSGVVSRTLWVGNIDPTLMESDLSAIFCVFGQVESVRLLPDKECAFINYVNVSSALEAKKQMQGGRVGNCIVKVGFGKAENSLSGVNQDQFHQQPSRAIWIGNLPPSFKPEDLLVLFEGFGAIESYRILPHKNCGFVNFYHIDDAMRAKQDVNGRNLEGLQVRIGFAKAPSPYDSSKFQLPSAFQESDHLRFVGQSAFEVSRYVMSDPCLALPPKEHDSVSPFLGTDSYSHHGKHYYHSKRMDIFLNHDVEGFFFDAEIPSVEVNQESFDSQNRQQVRDIRRRLDRGNLSYRDMDVIVQYVCQKFYEFSTDSFGNTVVQKVIERSSEEQRERIVYAFLPILVQVGVHKNGTWVVQKIMECARNTHLIDLLLKQLIPYTAALLMDPFGNYVVQGCLRLGEQRCRFVFDAMSVKCLEIGQGKFGARAMRACLESPLAPLQQQHRVAQSIIMNSLILSTNQNGILLLHWLLDNSDMPGRYFSLGEKLLPQLPYLANQKLAHVIILKILVQTVEPDARRMIVDHGLFKDVESVASTLFGGHAIQSASPNQIPSEYCTSLLIKCIQLSPPNRKQDFMATIQAVVRMYSESSPSSSGPSASFPRNAFLQRLLEEASLSDPTSSSAITAPSPSRTMDTASLLPSQEVAQVLTRRQDVETPDPSPDPHFDSNQPQYSHRLNGPAVLGGKGELMNWTADVPSKPTWSQFYPPSPVSQQSCRFTESEQPQDTIDPCAASTVHPSSIRETWSRH